jgi:hypothetical protein
VGRFMYVIRIHIWFSDLDCFMEHKIMLIRNICYFDTVVELYFSRIYVIVEKSLTLISILTFLSLLTSRILCVITTSTSLYTLEFFG